MVTGKRAVIVKGATRALHRQADPASPVVARAEAGVMARLLECKAAWCRIETTEVRGWVQRGEVWGVYPDETVQ
jgi:SH3-like domain-containing protein